MATDTTDIIKWLRFTRIKYKIKWDEVEDELSWEEDTISGIDLTTFTYSELTSIKYALIDLIKEKRKVDLGRVDV